MTCIALSRRMVGSISASAAFEGKETGTLVWAASGPVATHPTRTMDNFTKVIIQ